MKTFHCLTCNLVFDAEGDKQMYNNPVFGPCESFYAICNTCGLECSEYIKPKPLKKSRSSFNHMPKCNVKNSNGNCCNSCSC